MPAGEISLAPEDFEDIRPKDDGTVQTIDTEARGLTGKLTLTREISQPFLESGLPILQSNKMP